MAKPAHGQPMAKLIHHDDDFQQQRDEENRQGEDAIVAHQAHRAEQGDGAKGKVGFPAESSRGAGHGAILAMGAKPVHDAREKMAQVQQIIQAAHRNLESEARLRRLAYGRQEKAFAARLARFRRDAVDREDLVFEQARRFESRDVEDDGLEFLRARPVAHL